MATNKTIQPTNVTVQIPAMADVPDASVFSNAIDKSIDGINALNSQIATQTSAGTFSNETQLNSLLDTLLSAMPSGGIKVFEADCNGSFNVFKASTRYFGTIYKTGTSTSYAHVDMRAMEDTAEIWGRRVSTGGYLWVDIASQITTITTVSDTGTTSATGAINLTSLFTIYSGTRSIIGLYAESASYPNGIIGHPVKIGSSWFGIFTDTTGAIIASKSITVYATIAVVGFG